jgi:hypothetical protein
MVIEKMGYAFDDARGVNPSTKLHEDYYLELKGDIQMPPEFLHGGQELVINTLTAPPFNIVEVAQRVLNIQGSFLSCR